jgi:hypothetical protein
MKRQLKLRILPLVSRVSKRLSVQTVRPYDMGRARGGRPALEDVT